MKLLSCLLVLFVSLFAHGQTLQGSISDALSHEPLPFANIYVSDKSNGTISNAEGKFVLDHAGLTGSDLITFSFIGYQRLEISLDELRRSPDVLLRQATISLSEVAIYSKELNALDILDKVRENYEDNHPKVNLKQRVFYHKYEETPWPEENKIDVRSSDFVGLNKQGMAELLGLLPEVFIEYHDAIADLYTVGEEHKLDPVKAISLEEGSMESISEEMRERLQEFMADIEKAQYDDDIYYKIRSGILAGKIETGGEEDSIITKQKADSIHHLMTTDFLKESITNLFEGWASPEGKNWDFLNKTGKYKYTLEEPTILNDELVYCISFLPKNKGLFEGRIYVSAHDFGIYQINYAFADGKEAEKFQVLGIGHSMNDKSARVIFEKAGNGYFVKYINAAYNETARIERDFTIMKKRKRFLWDKELNEIKLSADLQFDMDVQLELLVLERSMIEKADFERFEEPRLAKFRKEYAYTPEMWGNSTVIAPSEELQKYKRAEP